MIMKLDQIEMAKYDLAALISADKDMAEDWTFENVVEDEKGGEHWYDVEIQELAQKSSDIIDALLQHVQELRLEVSISAFSSCTCLTKTPNYKYHIDGCNYKRKSALLELTNLTNNNT